MFNNDEGKREMAYVITRYAYRDTALEDFHSISIKMDMSFYKKIYNIVYAKLKKVSLLFKYIENYQADELKNKEDYEKLLDTIPEELKFKFMRFLSEVYELLQQYFEFGWAPAKIVDCDFNGKSLAKYVLSGRFIECCKNGSILDDKTMCYINKDIHNRIYTLLINGFFS